MRLYSPGIPLTILYRDVQVKVKVEELRRHSDETSFGGMRARTSGDLALESVMIVTVESWAGFFGCPALFLCPEALPQNHLLPQNCLSLPQKSEG